MAIKFNYSYRKYTGLPKTTECDERYGRAGMLWGIVALFIAAFIGVAVAELLNTIFDLDLYYDWMPFVVFIVFGIVGFIVSIRAIVRIRESIHITSLIKHMFSEINISSNLRDKALSAFLTKGSPFYKNVNYAYMIASSIKYYDNERKHDKLTTEEYKKIATDLIDVPYGHPSAWLRSSYYDG